MVQILPKIQSRGENFGQAFGQAIGKGIPEYVKGKQQQVKQAKQSQQISKLTGIDVSDLDPEMQQKVLEMYYSQKKAEDVERLKQTGQQNRLNHRLGFAENLLGGGTQQQEPNGIMSPEFGGAFPNIGQNMGQRLQGGGQSGGMEPSQISDKDLAIASIMDPNLGRSLGHSKDVALREGRENRDIKLREKREGKKEVSESFRENQKYIEKTYDQYEDSLRREAILGRMEELNDDESTSESGVINLLRTLGIKDEWLKNPSNEEYNKLSLDLLGGGTLQADYGSRVLASEFAVSQQRVPTLMQTREGRKQISENIKAMMLPAKLKNERMQYYLDKADRTGKPLPHNLRGQIMRDIKPQLEEVYEEFKKRNGRYKVKQGTNVDENAIEKYYYLSKGNEDKAMKMMEEDGYNVK